MRWKHTFFAKRSVLNDGVVLVLGVKLYNATELGPTLDCHSNLLCDEEYSLVKENVLIKYDKFINTNYFCLISEPHLLYSKDIKTQSSPARDNTECETNI